MSIISVKNDTASKVSIINAQKPVPPTINGYGVEGTDDLRITKGYARYTSNFTVPQSALPRY